MGSNAQHGYQQNVLTALQVLQNYRPSSLFTLMEESPAPPVPPKDPGYQYQDHTSNSNSMDVDRPPTDRSSAPASGSKRKRDAYDHDYSHDERSAGLAVTDGEDSGRTPSKRSRSNVRHSESEYDLSDQTPTQQRNLRRRNGIRNLSNLNLRHAASLQKLPLPQNSPPRESKFQEGSLSDKPSEIPPSVYTRLPRTDSGNLEYVEELMADYHDGLPTPSGSLEQAIEHEKARMPQRVSEINGHKGKDIGNPGMFRFGKSWASNFHPVSLWNRLWNDTKDDLNGQNSVDAEKRVRTKAEVEAKYAQLKSTGQLGLQPVPAPASYDALSTPYDSAIVLDNGTSGHRRNISGGSQLRPSNDTSRDGSDVPEPPRTIRGRLSRLHLRKPSMTSLTGTVKRTKSEHNLAAGAADHESLSSVSPTKAAFDGGSLVRRSHSRYDLKKQNRLSKRVSDLESKLNKARAELDTALAEASPMPKLGNKFERFTPAGTMKRSKFVPGGLPTLPSERLLFPDMKSHADLGQAEPDRRPRNAIDLSKGFDDVDDDETVKPARGKVYPARAQDLFPKAVEVSTQGKEQVAEQSESANEKVDYMDIDPETLVATNNGAVADSTKNQASDELDAKLKALDASVKANTKSAKSKKRMSTAKDDSGSFRPRRGDDADDDAEWEEAEKQAEKGSKKKRKSVGEAKNSPQTKRANASGKQKSPRNKLVKKSTTKVTRSKNKAAVDKDDDDALGSEDELAKINSRNSIDAENQSLEPLFEEEEEVSTQQLKDEPNEPTATATPAKYERNAVLSRSNSPQKRPEPAAEEKMMVRAAKAVVQSRPVRSTSPPAKGYSKRVEVVNETISVVPGQDGVPQLPNGTTGSFDSFKATDHTTGNKGKHAATEEFEWPDDVF